MSSSSCGLFLILLYALIDSIGSKGRIEFEFNTPCQAPRGGICVNIWECPFYEQRLKTGSAPLHLKAKIRANFCGLVNATTPKVCCRSRIKLDDDIGNHAKLRLLPMDTCGPISHGSRIVEGGSADPREFPWMALIAYKTEDSDDQEFKCGGSLINERYVLTAAHCLDDKSVIGVRLGEFDIAEEVECYKNFPNCEPPVQDILSDKIIMHKKYNPSTYIDDIGLIRLAHPANIINENVKPICLPSGDLLRSNLLGKFLTVTGWGTTATGYKSMVLHKVEIPVVPLNDCRKRYGKFSPIMKTQVCAGGYKGRDSCSGDSGGPLQYIALMGESHRYVQDGIVSYGSKQCGIDGWPAVYTNVKEYMSWILDNVEP